MANRQRRWLGSEDQRSRSRWAAIVVGLAVALVACSGNVGSDKPTVDSSQMADSPTGVDGPYTYDAPLSQSDQAQRLDQAGQKDSTPVTRDGIQLGACANWSAWTCKAEALLLCKASCSSGGQTFSISCLNKGSCVCGLSMGTCGTFKGNSPCEVCQKAVQASCCTK